MLPSVKTEKEHGLWFRGWRTVKATGSKGVQWLHDIGLSEASIDVGQMGINAPKPTNSTPSYSGTYGPDLPRSPSIPVPSISDPVTTHAPTPQPTFIPPTVEEPTFGPQNPFFPTTTVLPPPVAMPQLPPSHVSRYEIGAYADLYKEGASIPQLPGISNPQTPAQTHTPQRPAPSFGSVVVKTVAHHLFKNSRFTTNLVQTDPAMAAPTFSNPEGPSGFDPDLQAKFPEAYALAVRIDRFGKNQIALLKVTMEPPKPSLFKEFAWLGRLLKKGTGHDLYTPGVHTEGFQPVAIKVEAMVLEAAQSTKRFALQRVNNPIQADIDVTLAFLRGAGELAKGTFEFLLDTNNPDDVISRDLLNTLDVLASNIDLRFTSMIHQINPAYNPHSPASQAGSELFKALLFERILIGKTATITQGSARAVGGLAARSEGAFANQSALLGRINKPAYRSGFVGERAASKLAERDVRPIKHTWSAGSINSQVSLNKKLKALEKAQKTAVKVESLPDGRIRYYKAEIPSKTPGPTRGASLVTEYNPKNGQIRSWNECYDRNGNVNRVHPKTLDGQDLMGQYYPPTKSEIEALSNIYGSEL